MTELIGVFVPKQVWSELDRELKRRVAFESVVSEVHSDTGLTGPIFMTLRHGDESTDNMDIHRSTNIANIK